MAEPKGNTENLGTKENLKGNFSERDLKKYVVVIGSIGLVFLFLSWIMYPPENNYSIMKDTISFLGSSDADNNPQGWWLFSISLIFFGITLIPVSRYRYKRLAQVNKPFAALSFLFYLIASLGLILVAIFPDNGGESYFADLSAGNLHNLVSILGFGGFGFAFLIDFLIFLYDGLKTHYFKPAIWGTIYLFFFSIVGMVIYTQVTWNIICHSNCWPGDGIYSFPLWEWIVLFTVFFVIFSIILTLPNDIEELNYS